MPIFDRGSAMEADSDDMAKQAHIDHSVVDTYVAQLAAAGLDRGIFDNVLGLIKSDKRVKALEVAAIAMGYVGGGRKPATRSAAIASIGQHFVDLLRSRAKMKIAEKVRW